VGLDRGAHPGHQAVVVVQVVDRRQPRAQDLVGTDQMVHVGAGKMHAGVAVAFVVDRRGVGFPARVADADVAASGEQDAMACVARRQHAVELVDALGLTAATRSDGVPTPIR
jgi:hypothetical protein